VLLQRRLDLIRQIYKQDDRPWVIAYSGGKDSTAILQMIWLAIGSLTSSQRVKPIEIAYVDTGMEHPAFTEILSATFAKIRAASAAQGMPFRLSLLKPELKHRYFVAVIGRGYATPTHWFRWCTKDMRIKPMTRFIKDHVSACGRVVIVLGLRRAESQARREVLAKYRNGNKFQGAYGNLAGATALTPIEDFSVDEVWQFLMQTPCPWGDGNRNLARLYSLASGGECPSYSLGDGLNATCGGSRFGCWTCTVVRRDRAGEGLAEDDDRYELLLEFRNWLSRMRYERKRRWNVRRNGAPGPGPLRLSTRRDILGKLAEIQRMTGFPLLLNEELVEIQRLWRLDGDVKETALQIWGENIHHTVATQVTHTRQHLCEIKPLEQRRNGSTLV
jgi:DNA sulfur modification protein DndC